MTFKFYNSKKGGAKKKGKGSTHKLEELVLDESYFIAKGFVETIPAVEFKDNTNIVYIRLPDTITTIDIGAFSGCTSLESIKLPNMLQHIGASAFKNCKNLKEIRLPMELTHIDKEAFTYCKQLRKIHFHPESNLEVIDDENFYHCVQLSGVLELPQNLKRIGESCFTKCNISSVVFPKDIDSIGDYSFGECKNLREFVLNPINNPFNGIEELQTIMESLNIIELTRKSNLNVDLSAYIRLQLNTPDDYSVIKLTYESNGNTTTETLSLRLETPITLSTLSGEQYDVLWNKPNTNLRALTVDQHPELNTNDWSIMLPEPFDGLVDTIQLDQMVAIITSDEFDINTDILQIVWNDPAGKSKKKKQSKKKKSKNKQSKKKSKKNKSKKVKRTKK